MEQVLPGSDPDHPGSDPILEAHELRDCGRARQARQLLMRLVAYDPRCLDAHAQLGNQAFPKSAAKPVLNYETGVVIGRRSLAEGFDGTLPCDVIDNRPFLRCLHGYGLCLWRLGRLDEAAGVCTESLWLNPTNRLCARFLPPQVRAGRKWRDEGKRKPQRGRWPNFSLCFPFSGSSDGDHEQ